MSKIVIKKKVSLAFLGEEYKDAELVFRALPLLDYEKIQSELPETNLRYIELVTKIDSGELTEPENTEFIKLQKNEKVNNKKIMALIFKYLKEYFLSGKFPNEIGELENITDKEDLEGLDKDSVVKCFQMLTGQSDPKELTP